VNDSKKNWTIEEISVIYQQPFNNLLHEAHSIHLNHHDANSLQFATLLSIKTGACPEDCGYCSQSGLAKTHVEKEQLMSVDAVLKKAQEAKDSGATRFCMGAAWRCPPEKVMPELKHMIQGVKALGLETCMTLGMLTENQATTLSKAGLDYYNHNIDTSEEFYKNIITTRTFEDRLETLENVRNAGMKVCCGGILGMGEGEGDRASMLITLANLKEHPESVPINMLVKIKGTPFDNNQDLDPIDFIKTIAVARIMMPASYIRLSAGREQMNEQTQALCYLAGANSIFYGDKLLTTSNPNLDEDLKLLEKLGIEIEGKTCEGKNIAA